MINFSTKISPVKLVMDGKTIVDEETGKNVANLKKITPEVDRATRKLKLTIEHQKTVDGKPTDLVTTCIYNLDGWVGRYGKPIEFLLALHLGTMAPDFAQSIAVRQEFDTRVNIKLHKSVEVHKLTYRGKNVADILKDFNADYNERLNQLNAENNAARRAVPPRQPPWPNPAQSAMEWTEWRY